MKTLTRRSLGENIGFVILSRRLKLALAAAALAAVALTASPAPARIKLATLPTRDAISLSVEHPDRSLVQEERVLVLQKGVNHVDFHWENVRIDAAAILLEALDHPDEIQLIAVRYPPGENALTWELSAPRPMTERVRVTYFLDGVERDYAYHAVADKKEENLRFRQYLRLKNGSGERLENVTIHTGVSSPYVASLEDGEARQSLLNARDIPYEREFTWDAAVQPHDPSKEKRTTGVPISVVVSNDRAHGLGDAPLRAGKARIFQTDPSGSTAFLGEDWAAYTPVGESLKPVIGESRDIKITRKNLREERLRERRDSKNRVVLYDLSQDFELTVENFRDKSVTVTVLDYFANTWDVVSSTHPHERTDHRTLKFLVPLEAADSTVIHFTVETRNLVPGRTLQ